MPEMTRNQMIEWLIEHDIDYIKDDYGGMDWLRDVLASGFIGYANDTDESLRTEIAERKAFMEESCE